MHRPYCRVLSLVLSAALQGGGFGMDYRVVATTETSVPGLVGTNFSSFDSPVINDLGQVAFRAAYAGGEGIFSDASGSLTTVARVGTGVPGLADSFDSFASNGPLISDAGKVAFIASYPSGSGIFRFSGGSLATVARTGTVAPGGSQNFILFDDVALNAQGAVAFTGFTNSSAFQVYTDVGGTLTRFAGPGTTVPNNGFTTTSLTGAHSSVLNDVGRIAFIGNNGSARHGIYAGDIGSSIKNKVVLWTDPTGTGVSFEQPSWRPTINESGRVAFLINHNNPTSGIWYSDGGSPQRVALMGYTDIPGTSEKFAGLGIPTLNNVGEIAFYGGGSSSGLFRFNHGGSGALERIAWQSQAAPGGNGEQFLVFGNPLLSENGQIAFAATLDSGRRGIWALGADDALHLIALEQTPFDHDRLLGTPDRIIETVLLTTDSFEPRSPNDGTGTAFDNQNELAFALKFSAASGGGSGAYVTDVDTLSVPEPGLPMMLFAATAILGIAIRRRAFS